MIRRILTAAIIIPTTAAIGLILVLVIVAGAGVAALEESGRKGR